MMRTRPRSRWTIALLLLATGLSGCGPVGSLFGVDGDLQREHQQARQALDRWAAAVEAAGGKQSFVPVGELTGQIGDWEVEVGENNKEALMGGMIAADGDLPGAGGDREVRWDDGRTVTLPTISAEEALGELRTAAPAATPPDCPECATLTVTAARLSTATFQTSRGPATAPTWEFTIEGTAVVVTRIAVAANSGVAVQPPPWDPNDPPRGLAIESATGTIGGRELTVAFTGAPDTADRPCGEDYTAEAVESDTAVVVIVIRHPNAFAGACTAVGARRTATVVLAEPLGERAVLEVQQGLPVAVILTP